MIITIIILSLVLLFFCFYGVGYSTINHMCIVVFKYHTYHVSSNPEGTEVGIIKVNRGFERHIKKGLFFYNRFKTNRIIVTTVQDHIKRGDKKRAARRKEIKKHYHPGGYCNDRS